MAVTYIKRIEGSTNNFVFLWSSDSTATCLGSAYLTAQAANIAALNFAESSNPFQWYTNDCILLSASDGLSVCSIDSTFTTLTLINNVSQANPYALKVANFTLTAAQFNGMYAAPVSVLAAQGAGIIAVPELIYLNLVYGSAQFAAGGAVGFQYGSTAHLAGTLCTLTEQATDFTGATGNTTYKFHSNVSNGSQISSAAGANAAVYISNDTAAFTTGTGASFSGTIFYRNIPV